MSIFSKIVNKFKQYSKPEEISYLLHHDYIGWSLSREISDMKALIYLRHRYSVYLQSLPICEESDEREKIIWWCWLQGEENAPKLCKACLNSLRKNIPDYKVVVLTEENIFNYVDFPNHIIRKYKESKITRAQFSDILRAALLVKYGGIWADSTLFCSDKPSEIIEEPLFVFKEWVIGEERASAISSWFICSNRNNPILVAVLSLLYKYWEENDKIVNYYLFHLFFTMAIEKYPELWAKIPRFPNVPPHLLQFEFFDKFTEKRWNQLTRMSDLHKLQWKDRRINGNIKDTFCEYVLNS